MSGDEHQHLPVEQRVFDVALGAAAGAASLAAGMTRPAFALARGVLGVGSRRARGGRTERFLDAVADRGEQARGELERTAEDLGRRVLRRAVDLSLAVIDLTELATRHIDLDVLAAAIDVDAVVARADLDAAVARVDIDAIIAAVDLDAVVAKVDLDAVLGRVDLDGIVARVDIDAVAARIDLDAIAKRIDPDVVIARVDVDAALARLDLAAIARQVIDAVDLPEILRQSTGTVASEAVRGIRAEGMNADVAVARFVDRLLRRTRDEREPLP